jgi:hypothetical protein
MNKKLRGIYEETVRLLRADPRVLAALMTGSVGTEREDDYSDVDPVFLVRAESFDELDRELPQVFAQAGVEPFLWWPERGNRETWRNYAVLFMVDGQPVQYDITIVATPEGRRRSILARQFIFDNAGVLDVVTPEPETQEAPQRLGWQVEIYWVYAYIHAKYLRRGEPFRLAAAQQELLQAHVAILRALHPTVRPDWWPVVAGQLEDPGERAALLAYLETPERQGVAARLPTQMSRFAEDAQKACRHWGVDYPTAAEANVRPYVEAVAASLVAL